MALRRTEAGAEDARLDAIARAINDQLRRRSRPRADAGANRPQIAQFWATQRKGMTR